MIIHGNNSLKFDNEMQDNKSRIRKKNTARHSVVKLWLRRKRGSHRGKTMIFKDAVIWDRPDGSTGKSFGNPSSLHKSQLKVEGEDQPQGDVLGMSTPHSIF